MAKAYRQNAAFDAYQDITGLIAAVHGKAAVSKDQLLGTVTVDVVAVRICKELAQAETALLTARSVPGISDMAKFATGDATYDVLAAIDTTVGHIRLLIAEGRNVVPSTKFGGRICPYFWYWESDGTLTQYKLKPAATASLIPLLDALLADGK